MSETYDVTVQKHRTPGGLLGTMDTVTYRVTGNPAQARKKAAKMADKRYGSGKWTIIAQDRRG